MKLYYALKKLDMFVPKGPLSDFGNFFVLPNLVTEGKVKLLEVFLLFLHLAEKAGARGRRGTHRHSA
jgi:hypothetical protein